MRDISSTVAISLFALWIGLTLFPQLPRRLVGAVGMIAGLVCLSLSLFWTIEVPISRTLDSALSYGSALVLFVAGLIHLRRPSRSAD